MNRSAGACCSARIHTTSKRSRSATASTISGSATLLRQLLEHDRPERTRLLMGYAGWGPGQLDAELLESAWLITQVELDLIFDVPAADMWETALRRLGAEPGTLQMSPGVH